VDNKRVEISDELKTLIEKVRKQWGVVRHLSPEFTTRALKQAIEYRDCYISFWRTPKTKYLLIYRVDRSPSDAEVIPWLQELFEDGQIHHAGSLFCRAFFQGDVYTTENAIEMMANSLANASEKDSNADAFDFSKTKLGKKLSHRVNGTS